MSAMIELSGMKKKKRQSPKYNGLINWPDSFALRYAI
jgi:hypothetical protein